MKYVRNITSVIITLSMLSMLFLPQTAYADPTGGQEPSIMAAGDLQGAGDDSGLSSNVRLMIDSQNRYDGMDKAYAEGYIPTVQKGNVYLVVPILCSGSLKDNCLRASLNLGDAESAPFVIKNYEKSISLTQSYVNGGTGTAESYVAAFWLELKADRCNGGYPVAISLRGEDETGNEVMQDFTVYVTITDGKDKKEDDQADENASLPKVVISSCQFSNTDIHAGDEITADITLTNTSQTESAKDLTAAISTSSEELMLLDQSNTAYVESIPPQGSCVVSFRCRVNTSAPQGQYSLALAMNYTDSKSNICSSDGTLNFLVSQPSQVQFDPLSIPPSIEVGDVAEASVQAMNLGRGKVYNVRAVISADGLTPQGTIFIGDLEPGTMGSGSTQVTVGSLTNSKNPYGSTMGTVTFCYEDEMGVEQLETMAFETTIQSPFSNKPSEPEDNASQWWIIIAVIVSLLTAFAAIIIIRKVRQREHDEMVEKILET